MKRSLSAISKRKKAIKTTQKITNAMKLVSISKLQQYKYTLDQFETIHAKLTAIEFVEEVSDKPPLYIAFYPDLGLVSSYSRKLNETIIGLDDPMLLVVGTQEYRWLTENNFNVVNDIIQSETLEIEIILEMSALYQETHNIIVLQPSYSLDGNVIFTKIHTHKTMIQRYNQIYEPSYVVANHAFQSSYIKCAVLRGYYTSKSVEYTMRRIAMEKACDSAEDMLRNLQLQYNRLRQEKITVELSDLMPEEG
ncbi:hypothetical protein AOC36_06945 [Erysipelothrix larvae]|uniref:ATP synthase F1 subunit gamma n=1 Tax=Erysipelothrix larvae TaxID=1514105 RepID=A0A0X8H0B5_9FIRM|nr:F0F1 ATP synthase subunit gamma [Erysipelothrix larvae]AMC93728.1 hypothetical protein AOC36_06945 [Erysipelothrix larvae]